jgi:hypothetical protein
MNLTTRQATMMVCESNTQYIVDHNSRRGQKLNHTTDTIKFCYYEIVISKYEHEYEFLLGIILCT